MDGVDAAFISPYDLSASMGKPGQIADPDVQETIIRVRDACQQRKKPLGIFTTSAEDARPYLKQGYTLVAAGVDTMMLGQTARDILEKMRT